MSSPEPTPSRPRRFHAAVWRWHFYAGVAVLPLLAVLAVSGLAMLVAEPLDRSRRSALLEVPDVPARADRLPATQLAAAAAAAYPHAVVSTYIPPRGVTSSAQVVMLPLHGAAGHGAHGAAETRSVYVDPYTGAVLGDLDPNATLYAWAKRIHGTLLLGTAGDYVIEIAAGLGVLLVATGLYLWWPRGAWRAAFLPNLARAGPRRWRELHGALAAWAAPVLIFFLVSGLAWTPFWGAALVQTWSSLPGESFNAPLAAETHAALDHGAGHEVPWAIAQTPLPASGSARGAPGIAVGDGVVTLDAVVDYARAQGLANFRVHLPRDENGVFTIAATTIAGDTPDPRGDRIVHLDAATGNVLGDVGFADYSPMGKFMAAGIPLHQGDTGIVNLVVNVLLCAAVLGLATAAAAAWWTRRPRGAIRLAPPPLPRDEKLWRGAVAAMLVLSLAFPLAFVTIAAVLVLDWLVVSRSAPLRRLFG